MRSRLLLYTASLYRPAVQRDVLKVAVATVVVDDGLDDLVVSGKSPNPPYFLPSRSLGLWMPESPRTMSAGEEFWRIAITDFSGVPADRRDGHEVLEVDTALGLVVTDERVGGGVAIGEDLEVDPGVLEEAHLLATKKPV